jgi:hypothetical protein
MPRNGWRAGVVDEVPGEPVHGRAVPGDDQGHDGAEDYQPAGVKFAGCMRPHGITNYPDPVEKGHSIQLGPGPDSGIDMNSAQYKAAQKACFALLPNGGP